jgi:hypothetical protein
MRLRLVIVLLALVLTPAAAAAPFKAVLTAPTHTPKANAKWYYTIRATRNGKPIRATVTVQIVDSFGGVHAVQYDDTKQNILRRPFRGVFRDYIQFPPESRGFRLTVRATVRALSGKIVLKYWIAAR